MRGLKVVERLVVSAVLQAGGSLDSRTKSGKAIILHEASKRELLRSYPSGHLLRDAAKAKFLMSNRGIFLPARVSGNGIWVLDLVCGNSSRCECAEGIQAKSGEGQIAPSFKEANSFFLRDVNRMAATAMQTVAQAKGQMTLRTVKEKNTDMTIGELREEILFLLIEQGGRCKLTNFEFNCNKSNRYLNPSLDRIDSSLGYIRGNLQIVTRLANFIKSSGNEQDWEEKALAIFEMVLAMRGPVQGG